MRLIFFYFLLLLVLSAPAAALAEVTNGLVGWWTFNEGSGTTAADSSSRFGATAHDGTLTNGPTWSTGPRGGAVTFDGSDDYILVGDAASLQIPNFTVMLWLYPTNLAMGQWQPLVTKTNNGGQNRNYGLYLNLSNPTVHYSFQAIDCTTFRSYDSTGNITANQWTHIAMTYNGTALSLYMNGRLDSSQTISGTPCMTTDPLRISEATATYRTVYGSIDDVRIYNRPLSAAEIRDVYQGGNENFGGE